MGDLKLKYKWSVWSNMIRKHHSHYMMTNAFQSTFLMQSMITENLKDVSVL